MQRAYVVFALHWGRLTNNSPIKKPPQHDQVPNQTNFVPYEHLSAQGPPKETKIAWVPQTGVDSSRNQLMVLLPRLNRGVIKVGSGGSHGDRSDHLSGKDEQKSDRYRVRRIDERGLVLGEERRDDDFQRGQCMRSIIMPAIRED